MQCCWSGGHFKNHWSAQGCLSMKTPTPVLRSLPAYGEENHSYPPLCPGLPEFRQWAWVTNKQVAPMCLLFLNRQSSKSGRILVLDLKTCVKEKKRMAVPSLVPSIIPVLKLVILSQKPWRFEQWNSLFSQLTTHRISWLPGGINNGHNVRALALPGRPWARQQSPPLWFCKRRLLPTPSSWSLWWHELPRTHPREVCSSGLSQVTSAVWWPAVPSTCHLVAGLMGNFNNLPEIRRQCCVVQRNWSNSFLVLVLFLPGYAIISVSGLHLTSLWKGWGANTSWSPRSFQLWLSWII